MTPEVLIVSLYLHLATCVGVEQPATIPRIVAKDVDSIPCGHLSPTGRCRGVYWPRDRHIVIALNNPGTLSHELLHDLLAQAGRPDPKHISPEWVTCHGIMVGEEERKPPE